ncbi:type VII secretion-associated serine protease mycosin [Streptomyces albus]|uniref:type VII secretion-associated serine protease mycosin n=1 Tax=Streptomyces albus TaxID=1888 RepID=UPI000690349E|nr:type VII secretion-associated serine protease mycosin [Streptomyces albus]
MRLLAGGGECTYPMKKQFEGRPWPLQRVLFDQLWQETRGRGADGRPVRVAVIDTGVDTRNPQLAKAVDKDSGANFLRPEEGMTAKELGGPTTDPVGHGTKVAGIIAARPQAGTGFVGLAPEAVIIPIRQNDAEGSGNVGTLAKAIEHAIAEDADVINISQDTEAPPSRDSALATAVRKALAENIVVVASAGNDGADGKPKNTYPAAYEGVLAVAASDRNNERAVFSQRGGFLGVAAPGVDIVSTVPGFGQCVDSGTSFSAPYVSGVAALIRAEHPDWTRQQVVAQIEQTAERSINGHDSNVGWGVVDPVRALTEDDRPRERAVPDEGPAPAAAPEPMALTLAETPQERKERYATYVLGTTAVLVTVVSGTAVVLRDRRRRRGGPTEPPASQDQ